MAYQHGIYIEEQKTAVSTPVESDSAVQVIVGTAPVNMSSESDPLVPKIAYNYDDAVKKVGFSNNFSDFTLCQSISASFLVYSVSPIVLINVLDPEKHTAEISTPETVQLSDGSGTISKEGILPKSLSVKSGEGDSEVTYANGKDYALSFDDSGFLTISRMEGGTLGESVKEVNVTYKKLDPSKVTEADILAGIKKISQVYPLFNLFPGLLLAPKWSSSQNVYQALSNMTESLNGLFKCSELADLDISAAPTSDKAPDAKAQNKMTNKNSILLWPKVKKDGAVYDYSAIAAAHIADTDANNDGVPYVSPSNKALKIDAICDADGNEIIIDFLAANALNGQGICTALNMNGWRFWGNRTAAYPDNTDIKDAFIPVRRMFNWWGNTFLLTYWKKCDDPMNKRLTESIVDSENIRAGGFKAKYQIAGAEIEYNAADNPTDDLINGKIKFRQHFTPYPPAEAITNVLEFDANAFKSAIS